MENFYLGSAQRQQAQPTTTLTTTTLLLNNRLNKTDFPSFC